MQRNIPESLQKAIEYCDLAVEGKAHAPKYVILQCKDFLKMVNGENDKYIIDIDMAYKVDGFLKLMTMADGLKVGMSLHQAFVGFQHLFINGLVCSVRRDDTTKRRYNKALLLIGRKNGKSFLINAITTLFMMLEPKYSEMYCLSSKGEFSQIVKNEMDKMLRESPKLGKHFNILGKHIECKLTKSKFKSLNFTRHSGNAIKSNIALLDELGSFEDDSAGLENMQSSQINMPNPCLIMLSTRYVGDDVLKSEIEYAKKSLEEGLDDTCFSLLFMCDENIVDQWQTNDECIYQANPLMVQLQANFDEVVKKRTQAIISGTFTNFLTKHLNIECSVDEDAMYIPVDKWEKCVVEQDMIEFAGQEVVIGLDLSMKTDLTGVSMTYLDSEDGKYYTKQWAFLPGGTLDRRKERLNYVELAKKDMCFICDGDMVNHLEIIEFICSLEEKYNCRIRTVAYDPYQSVATIQTLKKRGLNCTPINQNWKLGTTIKYFQDLVYDQNIYSEDNKIMTHGIKYAVMITDKNENILLDKAKSKKNKCRIDLLMSTIFSIEIFHRDEAIDWIAQ